MIFNENRLLADEQTILMKYHTIFFSKKKRKLSQNVSSAAVVIEDLRVKVLF